MIARLALSALLLLLVCAPLFADDDQAATALKNAQAAKAKIVALTEKDIPREYISSSKTVETDQGFYITYFRGERKVLVVQWLKNWTGKREKMFGATMYDGSNMIGTITGTPQGGTGVLPAKENYRQFVMLSETGVLEVMIENDKGFTEIIEVDGRKTHLADDLKYMNAVRTKTDVIEPFFDGVKKK